MIKKIEEKVPTQIPRKKGNLTVKLYFDEN